MLQRESGWQKKWYQKSAYRPFLHFSVVSMLSEAHTYSNAVFLSDFTDRHVVRERRGANCSAFNTSVLRCTYFLEFTYSTSLSSCSGGIQRKFVSPKYTYTVHPQTMQLLKEHLIDKTCPSVISTPSGHRYFRVLLFLLVKGEKSWKKSGKIGKATNSKSWAQYPEKRVFLNASESTWVFF